MATTRITKEPYFFTGQGAGHRYRQHPHPWLDRRPGVQHPCGARPRDCHPEDQARAADPCRWRQRGGRAPRRVRGVKIMKILVTNDDEIDSPGIQALADAIQR